MRIALFTDTYLPAKNGVVTVVIQLSNYLKKNGHHVIIIAPQNKYNKNIYSQKSISFNQIINISINFPNYRKIEKIIENEKIDLIHTHTEFAIGRCGLKTALKHNIAHIHTSHTLFYYYRHYFFGGFFISNQTVNKIHMRFLNKCKSVIAPSFKMENHLKNLKIDTDIFLINNSLSSDFAKDINEQPAIDFLDKYNISKEAVIIIYSGRLGKEKNILKLFSALHPLTKIHSNLHIIFAGNGPEYKKLKRKVHKLKIEKYFTIPGFIDHQILIPLLKKSSIYVTLSESEVNPVSVIEALKTKLPIVAIKDAAFNNLIVNGKNGYAASSIDDFTNKLNELILNDFKRNEFGNNSFEIASEFFSEINFKKTEDLYEKCISLIKSDNI